MKDAAAAFTALPDALIGSGAGNNEAAKASRR